MDEVYQLHFAIGPFGLDSEDPPLNPAHQWLQQNDLKPPLHLAKEARQKKLKSEAQRQKACGTHPSIPLT